MPHRRLIALTVLIVLAVALLLAPAAQRWRISVVDATERLIGQRPGPGMLAFVPSVVLVPAAVHMWGPAAYVVLLWTGWFLGGLALLLTLWGWRRIGGRSGGERQAASLSTP